MATIEPITNALGETYRAVQVSCEITRVPDEDEFFVTITPENYDEILGFYVPTKAVVEGGFGKAGWVKAIHLEDHDDGTTSVEILGEPVAAGPILRIPTSLLR